jgi:hypothetical protein
MPPKWQVFYFVAIVNIGYQFRCVCYAITVHGLHGYLVRKASIGSAAAFKKGNHNTSGFTDNSV